MNTSRIIISTSQRHNVYMTVPRGYSEPLPQLRVQCQRNYVADHVSLSRWSVRCDGDDGWVRAVQ